jgi:hypothetical protein
MKARCMANCIACSWGSVHSDERVGKALRQLNVDTCY